MFFEFDGVKVNGANGGPAPESLTDAIYACSKQLEGYRIWDAVAINLDIEPVEKPEAVKWIDPVHRG